MASELKAIATAENWRVGWVGPDGLTHTKIHPTKAMAETHLRKLLRMKVDRESLSWQQEKVTYFDLPE